MSFKRSHPRPLLALSKVLVISQPPDTLILKVADGPSQVSCWMAEAIGYDGEAQEAAYKGASMIYYEVSTYSADKVGEDTSFLGSIECQQTQRFTINLG